MLLDEASEVLEMFKHSFPLSMLFFVPLLIIISPASPVSAAHDFAVYRMQQYDLHGSAYGKLIVASNRCILTLMGPIKTEGLLNGVM